MRFRRGVLSVWSGRTRRSRWRLGGKVLEYFPVSERYQFRLKLQKYDMPGMVKVPLSSGEVVEVLRVGFLDFSLDGQVLRLQVYKKRPDDAEVFVPLRDGTSGTETYGAGRYVDVEVGRMIVVFWISI